MFDQRTNVALVATLCALPGCWGISGSGERARASRDLDEFVRIESHGELDVEVRQADDFRVVVSIDSNLLDNVDTRVRDQTLIIDQDINFLEIVSGPHVLIEMPHLTFAHLYGSGDVDARTFDEARTIRFESSGSGDLRFEGSAPRIEVDIDGSGDVRLAGSTELADFVSDGSGSIEARELEAAAASLIAGGSGDISVTVNGEVDAQVDGSGDIDVYGEVDLLSADKDGSGDIRVH